MNYLFVTNISLQICKFLFIFNSTNYKIRSIISTYKMKEFLSIINQKKINNILTKNIVKIRVIFLMEK